MTLRECYRQMGGNYDDVVGRFYSEPLVGRFLIKFLEDPCFEQLTEAFAAGNVKDAFCAAHTLKGICQNLSLGGLGRPLVEMTERLRAEDLEGGRELLEEVQRNYHNTIRSYQENPEESGQ